MKSILDFIAIKNTQKKFTVVTCYDYSFAKIIDNSDIDCILVGDSAAMVMYGYPDTTHATLDMMVAHTQAVARGSKKFLISDMPFMSYRKSLHDTMCSVEALIRAGAQAIKLEGSTGNLETIQHIVASGVPVMGHLGLTPQHIHTLGGFKLQGKNQSAQELIFQQALLLEKAGCFAIVLECIPAELAQRITAALTIPTIGIGAGLETDGQVLVLQDLLGLQNTARPKFLKTYLNGYEIIQNSLKQFAEEVSLKQYPSIEYSYMTPMTTREIKQ